MKKERVNFIITVTVVAVVAFGIYYYYKRHNLGQQIEMFKVNNEATQERAVAYMVREGKRAIPYLVDALHSEDPTVRSNAAQALGRIDEPGVINPLVEVLADADPNIQYEAMEALENRGRKAVPALLKTAESGDRIFRAKAIELLGRIGDPQSKEVIEKSLSDTSSEVRAQAVISLRWIAFGDAVELIVPMLDDPDANVRMMVVFALGELREHESARRALEKALTIKDNQLREKAAHFLGETGNPDTESALIKALKDRRLEVRWTACEALGKVGGDKALQALTNILLKRNEVEFVKSAAKKAIENIRERQRGSNAG